MRVVGSETFKDYVAQRDKWCLERYKKHETELTLDEIKELDQALPCWGETYTRRNDLVEVSMGGTRVRDPKHPDEEYKIYRVQTAERGRLYPIISIKCAMNDKLYNQSIHRLVASAFVVNPDPWKRNEVNHIDGNKWNDAWYNLEWVSREENQEHAFKTGLNKVTRGEERSTAKHTEKQIKQVCELLKNYPEYTFQYIADLTGVNRNIVVAVSQGRRWKHISKDYLPFPRRDISQKGVNSPTNKFTNEQVEHVCQLFDANINEAKLSQREISELTGVSISTVNLIYNGRNWTHISSKYDWYKAKFGDQNK